MTEYTVIYEPGEQLIKSFTALNIDLKKIRFVCIEREFGTWLLHDDVLLSAMVSKPAHPCKVSKIKDPLAVNDPKAAMQRLFRDNLRTFNPDIAALSFAKSIDSLNRLKKCDTFRYFAQAVLGKMPTGWPPFAYNPKGARQKGKQNK